MLSKGYSELSCNGKVFDPVTRRYYRIHLAYPQCQIAIEYDSDGHRTDRRRSCADRRKDEVLRQLG